MLTCPICKTAPLTGLQESCSPTCRSLKSRAARARREAQHADLLRRHIEALTSGATPDAVAELIAEGRRLLSA